MIDHTTTRRMRVLLGGKRRQAFQGKGGWKRARLVSRLVGEAAIVLLETQQPIAKAICQIGLAEIDDGGNKTAGECRVVRDRIDPTT